jgi:hypothetical protein
LVNGGTRITLSRAHSCVDLRSRGPMERDQLSDKRCTVSLPLFQILPPEMHAPLPKAAVKEHNPSNRNHEPQPAKGVVLHYGSIHPWLITRTVKHD